jgi:hypothetical protein
VPFFVWKCICCNCLKLNNLWNVCRWEGTGLAHCETPQFPHNFVVQNAIIFVSLELPVQMASISVKFWTVSD